MQTPIDALPSFRRQGEKVQVLGEYVLNTANKLSAFLLDVVESCITNLTATNANKTNITNAKKSYEVLKLLALLLHYV